MSKRGFLFLALSSVISSGLLLTTIPSVQAKTLVGTSCKQIGTTSGDGPGHSVICKKKGKRNTWQVLQEKIPDQSQVSSSASPSNQPSSNCQKLPQFTSDFIDLNYVRDVTPIGEQTGSGGVIAVRSYVHPSSQYIGKELPIFAPVDMVLNSANYYKPAGSSANYEPEYALYFDAGCGISVRFFHIKGVVGKVASAVPAIAGNSSAGEPVKPTPVKAGEQIGWYKLGENSVAFDFWVDNQAHTNNFIAASHFVSSNALHSVCPYDFYVQPKKALWLAKLGAPGSDPVPGTECGVVTQGLAGTADGMWFIAPDTLTDHLSYEGAYQSQIMFTTDPSGIIRIGGLNSSASLNQMMLSPQSTTYRKPADVKIGDTQCWSTANQSVRVNVVNTVTMTVIVGKGSCTTLPTSSEEKTYHR